MTTSIRRSFRTRRGRPRTATAKFDAGTPELIQKRAFGLTSESLDCCLQQGIIHPGQHRAALHYRWLYTLRHGRPTVQVNGLEDAGANPSMEAPCETWKALREGEYRQAALLLASIHALAAVRNVAVFNHYPAASDIPNLRQGLEELTKLWNF